MILQPEFCSMPSEVIKITKIFHKCICKVTLLNQSKKHGFTHLENRHEEQVKSYWTALLKMFCSRAGDLA